MDGIDLNLAESVAGVARQGLRPRRPSRRKPNWLLHPFSWFVMLPTLLAAIYFIALASPQYLSEAQFVVRGQSAAPPGMLSSLLQTAGGGASASEDTYAVQSYMMSRDAATLLLRTQDLRSVFDRSDADFLARFPNLIFHKGFEHFFWYYQKHVIADLDTTTGISTLTVRTFRPEDSQRIADALLGAAEQLVNRMNERQRQNLIASSQKEVADAEAQLRLVAAQIADYRNREALLDPMKQSTPILKNLSDLQMMLTTTNVQIAQLQGSAPGSPLIPVYRRRAQALQTEIKLGNGTVAGSDKSLVPKITAYDELEIQRDLLEKQLTTSAAALEAAKTQADHQALYLDEVVRPNAPDYAAYPRSLASIAIVFASCLSLFLMARLLIAGAREHQVH